MVSQVWEGVSRMTALAKQTTQAFLEGSVVLSPPAAGAAPLLLKGQYLQSRRWCHLESMMAAWTSLLSRVCFMSYCCGPWGTHRLQTCT